MKIFKHFWNSSTLYLIAKSLNQQINSPQGSIGL